MDTKTAFERFREIQKLLHAYSHATGVLYYDGVTGAPEASSKGRGETLGTLSGISYDISTGEETRRIVDLLLAHADELSERQLREVKEFDRENELIASIPKDEYEEYTVLVNDAESVWHRAKVNNDYASFEPYLQKIFDRNRKFALYYKPEQDPYDTMLDMYERGLTTQQADSFFDRLRESLVPLIKKVGKAKQPDDSFLYAHYPIEQQRRFSDYLMEVMGIDRARCSIGETEHPFTDNYNRDDVRITTHYYEDNVASSMYSVIHEGGHALYELGGGEEYEGTCLAGGVSMGIHESQSRLFENFIGRSRSFCALVFPKMQELFPEQLDGVTADDFYLAVNKSSPSLIRTEADELTYAMHIIIRYELEKDMIAGRLTAKQLPEAWNRKYKEYLGLDVPDDRNGVLQDSHWAGGSIGYFPSYALGSAYAAQIINKMRSDMDMDDIISSGTLKPLSDWLTQRIYRHSRMYDPDVLLKMCVEADFDPQYFIDYLTEKYSDIYDL